MNVIEFDRKWKTNVVFCMVDNTRHYQSDIRSLIINQAESVLVNIYNKGYKVIQWTDEDTLLSAAADTDSSHAVVFSTGTEFIGGQRFFDELEMLMSKDFFLAGHILDRGDAYYELHHQCYVMNLELYKKLGKPPVGLQQLGSRHTQITPRRSIENYHDDYTPVWIDYSDDIKQYHHKCHGWHILGIAFEKRLPVLVFDQNIRDSKIHMYPESPIDFYKQLSWQYHRLNHCRTEFVHKNSTETVDTPLRSYQQIVTPASGNWYQPYLDTYTRIIYYDYNQKSLDYWSSICYDTSQIKHEFVLCDLLINSDFVDRLDPSLTTFINLSNIFNYEGTNFFYSIEYRRYKEEELINKIKRRLPDAVIFSSLTADPLDKIPTWRINRV